MKTSKINSVRRSLFYFLLALLVVSVISFLFLKVVQPKDTTNDGFFVTLHGAVDAELDNSDHYPNYVYVYYPYYNIQQLTRGKTIMLSFIEWEENRGSYSATFWVPIEMEVIVTADSTGCNHNKTYISKEDHIKEVNLLVDESKCYEELNIPNTKDEVTKKARGLLDRMFLNMAKADIDESQRETIRNDLELGWEEINEVDYESDENKSLLHAYNAYWLGFRADYRLQLSELKECIENALPLIHNNSCVAIPYTTKTEIIDANRTYISYNQSWILRENVHNVNTIEASKSNIQTIYNERIRLGMKVGECKNALEITKKSYNNQENICELRKIAFTTLRWSQALALIAFGFIVYYPIRKWIEK